MKKLYIETYGCQMNVADTEVVFSILGKEGDDRFACFSSCKIHTLETTE